MTGDAMVWAQLALGLLNLALLCWLLVRRPPPDEQAQAQRQQLSQQVQDLSRQTESRLGVLESELRREVGDNARAGRQEVLQTLATFQEAVNRQAAEATRTQNAQIDAFAQQLLQLRGTLSDTLTRQLQDLSEANARRLSEVRATLEAQLGLLQQSNAAKLDEMRATVDEKLHATLEQRLGESFKQVAERLEQVHKGLGEMQSLAQGVGDLKHLLTNVKTRGMFGEAQLGALLEQVRQQVLDVALKHRLMSAYTSFVAVDERPVRDADQPLDSEAVVNLNPVDHQYPKTSLGLLQKWLLAAMLALMGVLLMRRKMA